MSAWRERERAWRTDGRSVGKCPCTAVIEDDIC
jgi:hypothetical protein